METLLLAEAPSPAYDAWYFLALLSRVAHTTCGATVLGGLIYLRCVVAPRVANAEDPAEAMYGGHRKSWAKLVAIASLLLLASGFYNFFSFNAAYENLPKLYHPLFGVKFLLALAVMFVAALLAGKSKLARKLQGGASGWLNVAIALAIVVFVLGAMLRSFRDLPGARGGDSVAAQVQVETEPRPSASDQP